MYRAVELCDQDTDLHRFVWRSDKTSEVTDYRMTRVTFGVASSPFVAVKALQQTAHDFGDLFPLAKPPVFSSFYVDDCLAGADSIQEDLDLYNQLRPLLLKGVFDLRKWRSNSQEVLNSIEPSLHEPSLTKVLSDNHSSQYPKALGMIWNSHTDCLHVSIGSTSSSSCTKRGVIGDIARTFDVLGWMAPALIPVKVLFQKLWELKLGWNEEIPAELSEQHQLWKNQLPKTKPFNVATLGQTQTNAQWSFMGSLTPRRLLIQQWSI